MQTLILQYHLLTMFQEFLIDLEGIVAQLITDQYLQLILYTLAGGTYPHGQKYLIYGK